MSERRRREYLKAMGYTAYRPKAALPGARPSPRWEPPEPAAAKGFSGIEGLASGSRESDAPPAAPEPDKEKRREPRTPEPAAAKGFSGIEGLASGSRESDAPPAAPEPDEEKRREPRTPEPAAAEPDAGPVWFRARCHSLGARLAVLDLAAVGGPPREDRGDRDARAWSLLKKILLALGADAADPPPPRVVEWTEEQAKLLPAPSRSAAAREFLEGVLEQWREREGFVELLAFAGPLAGLLREDGEPGCDPAPDAAGCRLTLTLSLDMMLADPRRKAEVWAHLQPLRRRLAQAPA